MRSLMIAVAATIATSFPGSADIPGQGMSVYEVAPEDRSWAVMSGSTLRLTIEGWSRNTGWTVVWDSPVDYRLGASAVFHGNFESAIGQLIDTIYLENPEIQVTIYRGNNVVHISDNPIASN